MDGPRPELIFVKLLQGAPEHLLYTWCFIGLLFCIQASLCMWTGNYTQILWGKDRDVPVE
jgi:hypothetical protein